MRFEVAYETGYSGLFIFGLFVTNIPPGVFCLIASPTFGQIVKASEPVMSAAVNTIFYNKAPSVPKVGTHYNKYSILLRSFSY